MGKTEDRERAAARERQSLGSISGVEDEREAARESQSAEPPELDEIVDEEDGYDV